MKTPYRLLALAGGVAMLLAASHGALAQKRGGILQVYHQDSPASMSILEEATPSAERPMAGVFNNLVTFDPKIPQNSMATIRPDLAESWTWSEDGTELTFKLRHGVKWHDGKPFTAADVKCTWDLLMGKSKDRLRLNPRKAWYQNVKEVTTKGDDEATFALNHPQPALLALFASLWSPVYPCHVSAAQMRLRPIGTGPFKFVEYKPNEGIKVVRNPDYWKKGRPYLDGIEYTIIPNRSTAILAFSTGKFDMTWPYGVSIPLLKDVEARDPKAICQLVPANSTINLIVNRDKPPFDDPDMRRVLMLGLDRKSFIKILADGKGDIGGAMLPPPAGVWGLPPEILHTLPGYGPDVEANRAEAKKLMAKHGYGPDNHLKIKVSTRNVPIYRDPAVILIDQLSKIYIDAQLEAIETANWFPKVTRKDYQVGLNLTASGVDDPDQNFYENYACGSPRNYTGYCNKPLQKLFDKQSVETDQDKRKKLVWEIDRQMQEDVARPIIYHWRAATCWHPYVKGLVMTVNASANGWRFEDVWLDR
jgi:peptide/nickel transport system substrate-binding protein